MSNRRYSIIFLAVTALIFVACRPEPPTASHQATTTPVSTGRPSPTIEALVRATSAKALAEPTETAAPLAEPTAELISISYGQAIPPEISDQVQVLVSQNLGTFSWASESGTVEVTLGDGQPLATWIYAAAVPFYTIEDDISLAELQAAWRYGRLILTDESQAFLQALWGRPDAGATIVPGEKLVETLWMTQGEGQETPLTILPAHKLDPRLKVLHLDGSAPVDVDFDLESYPLTVPISVDGDQEAVMQVLDAWLGPSTNWDDTSITHITMTGPAGMRRAVADRMEKYGLTYPAEETGPILQAADIAHMSNENAFASDCPMPDPFDSANVCNRDEYLALMTWMGIDVNEMTGNHLNDWGPASLQHTFDLYDQVDIETFGGGRDLADARQPLLMEHNGNRIAFVGCNPVGPEMAWAREGYPGSLPCEDYGFLLQQIKQLSDEGNLVIVTLQYNEDYRYDPRPEQRELFHRLAEAGAAAVSGSHGHHPQGFAFHEESFIHYGLGNLLADQMWSQATRQTFIDTYLVHDGRLLNVDLWTGLNEDYARIREMTPEERHSLLETVFASSEY